MSRRIVVADDEAHIRHVVGMKLSNAGYEVVTAEDGEEALEICLAERPDLVITDYQMPVMTGLELAEQLRQRPEMSGAPVLLLTARGFDIDQATLEAAGIVGVLSKPFSPREVLARAQSLLGEQTTAGEAVA
jgi:CheY-like chemotaxis protein